MLLGDLSHDPDDVRFDDARGQTLKRDDPAELPVLTARTNLGVDRTEQRTNIRWFEPALSVDDDVVRGARASEEKGVVDLEPHRDRQAIATRRPHEEPRLAAAEPMAAAAHAERSSKDIAEPT